MGLLHSLAGKEVDGEERLAVASSFDTVGETLT
jgi:hypothetical protein